MLAWLRQWSPRRVVATCVVYWLALGIVGLSQVGPPLWRATHAPTGQGAFSVSYGDGAFKLTVTLGGNTIWAGSIHFLALALWIGLPPLALWIGWISQRPARREMDAVSPRQ